MKFLNLALITVSFSVALAAGLKWPRRLDGEIPAQGGQAEQGTSGVAAEKSRKPAFPTGNPSHASADSDSALAPAPANGAEPGLVATVTGPIPTMDEVFNATGLDRMLLMARFIQKATPAELEEAINRCQRDRVNESTFNDQLWLRWVELDRENALKHRPPGTVWWAFAKLDPEAALREGLNGGRDALSSVIFSIAQRNPERARQLLSGHPEADPHRVEHGIMEGLTKNDPAAALTMAFEKSAYSVDGKFREWLNRDPEQAMAWMNGLTNPQQRRKLEDTLFSRQVESDPASALEVAKQLPAGMRQLNHSVEAIAALARQDPEAARAAVEAMPTPAGKQRALAALAGSLAASDTGAAVSLLSGVNWDELRGLRQFDWSYMGGSGWGGTDPASDLIRQLMGSAPEAAANALLALSAENGAPLQEAVQIWAGQHPEAPSAWLKDQPPGAGRDMGIQGLTQWLVSTSPEPDYASALVWAGSVTTTGLRDDLLQSTLEAWKGRDPQAAAAVVGTLPVPDEQKAELLKKLGF